MDKRILFVSNGLGSGGAERVVSILANYFAQRNYKVFILAFRKSAQEYVLNNKIKILHEPLDQKFLKKIKRVLLIRHYIKRYHINTVIAFSHYINLSAILAGVFLKAKIIISERNDPAQLESKRILNLVRKVLYGKADALVCQTTDARDYFNFLEEAKTIVIPNPIVAKLPKPFEGPRSKRIVTFSRIEPQKNIGMLIDAFSKFHKEYNDYILEIYGDGSCLAALKDYTATLGLEKQVIFYPFASDIHQKVLDASLFVLGSDYEGLSNSMIEAMALGLPCIVTDCPCGGARMMITSYENGILVPVKDVQAMYEAMKYMIENPEKSASMAKSAAKVREKLAVGKIAAQWESMI